MSRKQQPPTKFLNIPFVHLRENCQSAEENEVLTPTHLENHSEIAKYWKKQAEKKKIELGFRFWKRTNELQQTRNELMKGNGALMGQCERVEEDEEDG